MNIQEILKQFKNVRPDENFFAISKRAILATEPKQVWGIRRTILRIIETGVAVSLAGFFILLITGAFSGTKLAPVQFSAINTQNLRAEAEAIDIQIQLANVTYENSIAESTPKSASPISIGAAIKPGTQPIGGMPTSTATSTTVTIDQALEGLSN